jgi:hypothetical protein
MVQPKDKNDDTGKYDKRIDQLVMPGQPVGQEDIKIRPIRI